VGVFQIEIRAQMATLPRMKPDHFYDLVVEVAIIRPGPIVGQMVHPYLDRRAGRKPVEYAHPSLEPILKRTLGVPLFQEQLLRMAMTVAGFTGGEAEELRRAMGFKRSEKRMAEIEAKLRAGMGKNGIEGAVQDQIVKSIASFALYGIPESHAASFALLAYASAWLRAHHHAAFVCALLNNQPMGFYHPMTLVKDAQRHGVRFLPVDVTKSSAVCTLENGPVRLGLNYVTSLRAPAVTTIIEERNHRPFASIEDFARRTKLHADELERLASIGAFAAFDRTRRDALWQAAALGQSPGPLFDQPLQESRTPLPEMSTLDRLRADIMGTDLTIGPHPVARFRDQLKRSNVLRAVDLPRQRDGDFVRVAGAVICRQRPGTAKGFLFLTLEDETGLVNVIVRPDQFDRFRALLTDAPLLRIDGVLQSKEGTTVRAMNVTLINQEPEETLPEIPVRSFR
jgi:error-prone DNA polymerase